MISSLTGRSLAAALLAYFIGAPSFAAEKSAQPMAEVMTTKAGVRYGIWPARPSAPAPTLFVLASTIEGTLNDTYYRQSANKLSTLGYLCVSIDLPCHGQEVREGEPPQIQGWCYRCEHGEDIMADVTKRLSAVLDELISTGMTDPQRIAVCGTSRGGFTSLHFAAADPRVKAVVALAPPADLNALREFQKSEKREMAERLALKNLADKLIGRPIWLIIGDRDERVGTDLLISFARTTTAAALAKKAPSWIELRVVPEPGGHRIPPGTADLAADWIHQTLNHPPVAK
jgi:dienelactone hydrolase